MILNFVTRFQQCQASHVLVINFVTKFDHDGVPVSMLGKCRSVKWSASGGNLGSKWSAGGAKWSAGGAKWSAGGPIGAPADPNGAPLEPTGVPVGPNGAPAERQWSQMEHRRSQMERRWSQMGRRWSHMGCQQRPMDPKIDAISKHASEAGLFENSDYRWTVVQKSKSGEEQLCGKGAVVWPWERFCGLCK